MSTESVSRISDLTGFATRTIRKRLDGKMKGKKQGSALVFETKEALKYLYLGDVETELDLTKERARLTHHQANSEALKEKQLRGELIPVELVVELGSGMVSAAKTKLISVHNKVKSRFIDLDQGIIDEIEAIHKEALEELGDHGIPAEIRESVEKHIKKLESPSRSID